MRSARLRQGWPALIDKPRRDAPKGCSNRMLWVMNGDDGWFRQRGHNLVMGQHADYSALVDAFHLSRDRRPLQRCRQLIDDRMHAWKFKATGNIDDHACALVVALIWP